MHKTLLNLSALLSGETVYDGSLCDETTLQVLVKLVEGGEVIEHRSGSNRWWKIEPNTLAFVRKRRAEAA